MSHVLIQVGPTSIVSGSSPSSNVMTKYCRYMCLAIASKNEMGTRHITFVSMLNRMLPNHLVKVSRNGIHFFGRPPPHRLLRFESQTSLAACGLYCIPFLTCGKECLAQGVNAMPPDSATTELDASVAPSVNDNGALRDNGGISSASTGCCSQ